MLASYKAKAATEEGREVSASEGKEEEEEEIRLLPPFYLTEGFYKTAHFLRLWKHGELQMRGAEG